MKTEQKTWTPASGWNPAGPATLAQSAQLVLVFGAMSALRNSGLVQMIREFYPAAHIFGCSTAGEICGTLVSDDSLVTTAIHFEHTQLRAAQISLGADADGLRTGEYQARQLQASIVDPDGGPEQKLAHVLVLADGLLINGSELVRGLMERLPVNVAVTGGMAGDGARFGETLVFNGDRPEQGIVSIVGLYGSRLKVGFGCAGGWSAFGPERRVTRSKGNVLFELDGRPALALYKQYLGEHARGLPGTGLLFPLNVWTAEGETPVTRAVLGVDEEQQSMTFGGDVPEGAHARLTKANSEKLVDGAIGAARACLLPETIAPELALLISCVGRKLVLKQRVEEEVEGVREILGEQAMLAGFYSYGEIAPFAPGGRCELHNETMTITTFAEV
ncbi:MAG: hypothetical protein JWQ90_3039 [Hydrocarboniphaga sp.]|uniref:FIST signal transduction protein n=1 Tax=Hydrocarboniphaga sp. TaxID=2033016 RepID=UPI00261DEDEC|nr:FIST N-terminal domain-containing protein [Hydrocarboniphaga sp.]MDB5970589.1 hypothetical protein [Hydrocarboniphaga sp.]